MTINFNSPIVTVIVVAIMTGLTRALPHIVFGGKNKMPKIIEYLGNVLPAAIMIILVAYCLRDIKLTVFPFGLAEIISVIVIVLVQYIKKNTVLSIIVGTACYMVLIRTVFPA